MRRKPIISVFLIALAACFEWSSMARAGALEDLIAGAKKEGSIEFYGPSTLGPEGAQALAAGFNKKYGLNITLHFNASGNMTRDTGKVIGLSASGQPPEWDVMVVPMRTTARSG